MGAQQQLDPGWVKWTMKLLLILAGVGFGVDICLAMFTGWLAWRRKSRKPEAEEDAEAGAASKSETPPQPPSPGPQTAERTPRSSATAVPPSASGSRWTEDLEEARAVRHKQSPRPRSPFPMPYHAIMATIDESPPKPVPWPGADDSVRQSQENEKPGAPSAPMIDTQTPPSDTTPQDATADQELDQTVPEGRPSSVSDQSLQKGIVGGQVLRVELSLDLPPEQSLHNPDNQSLAPPQVQAVSTSVDKLKFPRSALKRYERAWAEDGPKKKTKFAGSDRGSDAGYESDSETSGMGVLQRM